VTVLYRYLSSGSMHSCVPGPWRLFFSFCAPFLSPPFQCLLLLGFSFGAFLSPRASYRSGGQAGICYLSPALLLSGRWYTSFEYRVSNEWKWVRMMSLYEVHMWRKIHGSIRCYTIGVRRSGRWICTDFIQNGNHCSRNSACHIRDLVCSENLTCKHFSISSRDT
jgi:hypothetical protein